MLSAIGCTVNTVIDVTFCELVPAGYYRWLFKHELNY